MAGTRYGRLRGFHDRYQETHHHIGSRTLLIELNRRQRLGEWAALASVDIRRASSGAKEAINMDVHGGGHTTGGADVHRERVWGLSGRTRTTSSRTVTSTTTPRRRIQIYNARWRSSRTITSSATTAFTTSRDTGNRCTGVGHLVSGRTIRFITTLSTTWRAGSARRILVCTGVRTQGLEQHHFNTTNLGSTQCRCVAPR